MNLFVVSGLLLFLYMTGMFLAALKCRDNSIVDIAYGPGFLLVGWSAFMVSGSVEPRAFLLLTLVSCWGMRLAIHIFMRKGHEAGEDSRYRQWRERWGKSFVVRSFFQIFMLQGVVIYLVALPLLIVTIAPGAPLTWLDLAGVIIWLAGFSFEAVGDWQLLRFKRNPDNKGKIMTSGLWRLTRHPNYFGEALLWWGIFIIALGSPLGWYALVSPLLISLLVMKVSGIPMLEQKYAGNPEFDDYRKRTNAFFPWFPGGRKG